MTKRTVDTEVEELDKPTFDKLYTDISDLFQTNATNFLLKHAIESISNYTKQEGLNSDELIKIAELVVNISKFERHAIKLLQAMRPKNVVPVDAVLDLLGAFRSYGIDLQNWVMKWIVMVFDLIQPKKSLHLMYQLFFHYLDYEQLRPWLCNILFRLTRKNDVKRFRIRYLYSLRSKVGDEDTLLALLHIYKEYYNNMIIGGKKASKNVLTGNVFKCPNSSWFYQLLLLQERHSTKLPQNLPFGIKKQLEVTKNWRQSAIKASKDLESIKGITNFIPTNKLDSIIPPAKTIPLEQWNEWQVDPDKVWIEQLNTFEDFMHNFHRLELPNQMVSVLRNRNLAHFISLDARASSLIRLDNWLQYEVVLLFHWSKRKQSYQDRSILLSHIVDFVNFTMELSPSLERFVVSYLLTWDGFDNFDSILKLIEWTKPSSYKEIHETILKPLSSHFFSYPPQMKAKMIDMYTNLLQNWLNIELLEINKRNKIFLFSQLKEDVDYMHTIYSLVVYVNQISLLALQQEINNIIIMNAILSFLEVVSSLRCKYKLPFTVLPNHGIVFRCLLSSSVMPLSRICGLLVKYKRELEHVSKSKILLSFPNGLEKIRQFNSYVIIFYNALWRNVILTYTGKIGLQKPPEDFFTYSDEILEEIRDSHSKLDSVLCLQYHPALIGFRRAFLMEFEDVKNKKEHFPVTLTTFEKVPKVRKVFLVYLKNHGFIGLYDFLSILWN